MINRMIAIDASILQDNQIAFLLGWHDKVCELNSKVGFRAEARILPELMLSLLVGIPEKSMTLAWERYARAVLRGACDVATEEIFVGQCNWRPVNPNWHRGSLADAELDIDFCKRLSRNPLTWQNITGVTLFGASAGTKKVAVDSWQMYAALGAFGFSKPEQFFRPRA